MNQKKDELRKTLVDVVQRYYDKGLWIIPLCPPTLKVGDCYQTPWGQRAVRDERQIGKAPFVSRWQKERVSLKKLLSCFDEKYEHTMNIGVVTGKVNNIVVLDIDYRKGGEPWYKRHKDELEGCLTEYTSDGVHLYYLLPNQVDDIPNSGDFAPGVEVKADGCQVVTYPSIHPSGKQYHFEYGLELVDGE